MGVGGWWWGLHQRQTQIRTQAQALVEGVGKIEQINDLKTLTSAKSQLQKAIALLKSMPQGDPQVTQELAAIREKLTLVERRLQAEKDAAANLKLAQQLSRAAEKTLGNNPNPEARQTAAQKLQTAINLLEVIPPTAFVAKQAQTDLAKDRQRYSVISGEPVPKPQFSNQPMVSQGHRPIQVVLNFQGQSWLQVTTDGKIQYEGILSKGTQKTWTAREKLILRVGNAGNILAGFNGAPMKPLGKPGEVSEYSYTPKEASSRQLLPNPRR